MSNKELEEQVDDLDKKSDALYNDWYSEDKTPEDRAKTEKVLRNSTIQFRLLKFIIAKMFREHAMKENDLDKPNWQVKVAYNEGYKTALKELYRLLP